MKPAATGRVNLHARTTGLFTVDKELIDSINHVDPAVTIATVAAFAPVVAGQMVATVKIIPFAVPEAVVDWIVSITADRTIFEVHPYRAWSVGVVQTVLPSVKESVLDKTRRVTEARLAHGMQLLYTTDLPLKTVAARAGYRSAASFSRRFAEQYGLAPTDI